MCAPRTTLICGCISEVQSQQHTLARFLQWNTLLVGHMCINRCNIAVKRNKALLVSHLAMFVEKAVCKRCKPREAHIYMNQVSAVRKHEKSFSRLWTQCQQCQGSLHQDVLCSKYVLLTVFSPCFDWHVKHRTVRSGEERGAYRSESMRKSAQKTWKEIESIRTFGFKKSCLRLTFKCISKQKIFEIGLLEICLMEST